MIGYVYSGLTSLLVLAVFAIAVRARLPAALSPVLVTGLVVAVVLVLTRTPVERFETLTVPLRWALGSAIVALGATVHSQRVLLRQHGRPLLIAITTGAITGVVSALGLARGLGLTDELTAATLTRTMTTPFAVLVQTRVGGPISLAAGFAVAAGVIGAILLPPVLKLLGLTGPATVGTAVGVAAHIVGTDAVGRRDPAAAGYAGIAMILAGVIIALALPPLWGLLLG